MNDPSSRNASQGTAKPADGGELLRRYAEERDEDAFAELVRRHLPLVYGAALRQLDGAAHRAEEVTQSIFTDLARKAAAVSRRTDLAGWLYTSTHFAAAKLKRTEQRRQQREQEAHTMHELLSRSPADVDWERLRPVLDDAMHELGDRERELILQRFFQGRRFAEVGEKLGLSEDAARMRVERALEKLRGLLARRQITSTTAALAVALANQPAVAVPAGLAATVTGAALTSAQVATGTMATVLQFMTTSKIVVGVAGVALLAGSLGIATHESRARVAAESSLAAASGEVARLDGRLRDLRQRMAAAEQALQDERTELASVSQASLRPAASSSSTTPEEAGKEFLARHPEARGLLDEITRAGLASQLIAHYRVVNLTPDQREQLETIVARSMAGTRTLSLPDGPITLRREKTLTTAEMEVQVRQLIGDDNYAQFMTAGRALSGGLDLATQLASAVYRTEPLDARQTERMLRIFAEARSANPGDPRAPDWPAITAEAAGVLTPSQLAALAEMGRRNATLHSVNPGQARTVVAPRSP